MDLYTTKTKLWLDDRFKSSDEYGVYVAHQPIYGFREGHCEPGLFEKYIRTYQIMKALSHIECKTLLDVGGAEGYKSYIAKELFNVKVKNSDLSEEACKRAEEIFEIESVSADIHNLSFNNNEFDVVLCSETLEHVTDVDKAIKELLRVASKAILITVPHESQEEIKQHIKHGEIHGHIHSFDVDSFHFLKSEGYEIIFKKMISNCSSLASKTIESELIPKNIETARPLKRLFLNFYNYCIPMINKILNKRAAALS